jgi:hypothetical protein
VRAPYLRRTAQIRRVRRVLDRKKFCALTGSALIVVGTIACGQKGPPLPPLVLVPAPPVVTADRRGTSIDVGFTVPNANDDGSRPANIARIDIFAINGPAAGMTDVEMIKRGARVASVAVKSPRDPSDTVKAGESTDVLEAPEGNGLDQGAASTVTEQITASMLQPGNSGSRAAPLAVPLLGPSEGAFVRTYIGVGVDKRGRLGRFSKRVTVPLAVAPPKPSQPTITYNESKITVRWSPPPSERTVDATHLSSRPLDSPSAALTYNVYDSETGARLTQTPIKALEFEDTRIEWGATRCYAVRAVKAIGASTLESEAGEPQCEKLVDTFAPSAPKGLNAVSSEGAVSLIWEANAEPDVAGYYVLRGQPGGHLDRLTPTPIPESSFLDSTATRGVRFVYAVVAVDKAGNISAQSERVEETAR